MIRIREAIVVEGKYDRMRLNTLFDTSIIETGGFHVMNDSALKEMIRRFSHTVGIVILTDSDHAGIKLRSYLHSLCQDGKALDAYIPEVPGKEPRKSHPGAEGILGVEGIEPSLLENVVLKAVSPVSYDDEPVSFAEWFTAGLSGGTNSAVKRAQFLRRHGLPGSLSNKQALRYLNSILGPSVLREELDHLDVT